MNYFLPYTQLTAFFQLLAQKGYKVIGPVAKQNVIAYEEIHQSEDLPWGYQEEQKPGSYQLNKTDINEAFLFANGPEAVKPYFFKKEEILWQVTRDEHGKLAFKEAEPNIEKLALFGIRPCDVKALLIQDSVFKKPPHREEHYLQRRAHSIVIVVNCGYSAHNCFCVSANAGPEADEGYDIALTEIEHGFVMKSATDIGKDIVASLSLNQASHTDNDKAKAKINQAIKQQRKKLPMNNSQALANKLMENFEHPHWQDVASRCLACGNCTQVCPTCFCHQTEEKTNTDDMESAHIRLWDSCFNIGHSYMNHTVVRFEIMQRYRQWLIHKLATWWAQFGASGCVGCGRCISWCPTGIDITEEVNALCQ